MAGPELVGLFRDGLAGITLLARAPDGRSIVFTLRRTTDAGPHLHDTKRLEIYSLSTHKVRELTGPDVGGSHPDWQPLP